MQDFHSIPGRIFGGGGGGGGAGATELRRLVGGYPASMAAVQKQAQPQPQPVKCPRCDSTNTKFCYYNNYNLSQPRHFCKSCRRYWTKGGVLRNVPVGGGYRKSKRPSSSTDKDASQRRRLRSSGDTSSLPATTTTSTSTSTTAATNLLNSQIPAYPAFCPASEIFPSPAPPAAVPMPGFGPPDPPLPEEKPAEPMRAAGFVDQTVPVDPRPGGVGMPALDWSGAIDSHLFDLAGVVDPTAYWVDADPGLYFP